MFGLSYAYQADAHIRVDVLHERFSPELKAWIDLYGIVLFVLPFTALMLIYGFPFVMDSYQTNEVSQSPGGLELRWLIKLVLVLGFSFLALAAFARLTRLWSFLFFHAR
jgi:TRAP-type mannitol/chloroaromatic compound transport system permease small subunit